MFNLFLGFGGGREPLEPRRRFFIVKVMKVKKFLIIAGVAVGGYFLWQCYEKKKNQKAVAKAAAEATSNASRRAILRDGLAAIDKAKEAEENKDKEE